MKNLIFLFIPFIIMSCKLKNDNIEEKNVKFEKCINLSYFQMPDSIIKNEEFIKAIYGLEYSINKNFIIIDSLLNDNIHFYKENVECYDEHKNIIIDLENQYIKISNLKYPSYLNEKLYNIRNKLNLIIYEDLIIRDFTN